MAAPSPPPAGPGRPPGAARAAKPSLRWRRLALGPVLAVAAMGLVVGSMAEGARQWRAAQELAVRQQMAQVADDTMAETAAWLIERRDDARAWAGADHVRRLYGLLVTHAGDVDASEVVGWRSELAQTLRPEIGRHGVTGFALLGPDQKVLADSGAAAGHRIDLGADRALLMRALAGPDHGAVALPSVRPWAGAGAPGVQVLAAAPVWPVEDLPPGLLVLLIDPRPQFDGLLERGRWGESGQTLAFDARGRLIGPAPTAAATPPGDPAPMRARAGTEGLSLAPFADHLGRMRVGAWRWNEDLGLGIASQIDAAEALGPLQQRRLQDHLWLAAVVVLLGALGGMGWRARRRMAADAALLEMREARIAEQLAFQTALLDAIPSPVFVRGPDTRLLHANRAYEAAYGVRADEVRGTTVLEVDALEPQARLEHQAEAQMLLAEGGSRRSEQAEVWADGSRRTVLYQRLAFEVEPGRVGGMIGLLTDITALKVAEAQARDSEERLRRLLDAFPGYAVMTDKSMRFVYVNRALAARHGLTPQAMIGREVAELLPADRVATYVTALAGRPPGSRHVQELAEPSAHGRRRRFIEITSIIGPADEAGRGVDFTFGVDVTHTRRTAEFERFRNRVFGSVMAQEPVDHTLALLMEGLTEMAPVALAAVLRLDEDGTVAAALASRAMPEAWRQGLAGTALAVGARPEPALLDGVLAAGHACASATHPLVALAGRLGFRSCWIEPVRAGDGRTLGLVVKHYGPAVEPDNLDRHLLKEYARLAQLAIERHRNAERLQRNEAELRERQRQWQLTLASMQDGFARGGLDDTIEAVNDALVRMLGYASADELVGRRSKHLYPNRQAWEELVSTVVAHGSVRGFRCQARRKDGSLVWVEVSGHLALEASGRMSGVEALVRDISAQIEFEQALATARDAAQAAAQAKGSFLANMSHEIRTPMNAILGLSELALRTGLTPRQSDYLHKVQAAARRLLAILNDVLDLSKIESGYLRLEQVAFALDEVLEGVAGLVAAQVEDKGLTLRVTRGPAVPPRLVGDPLRLGQVLTNLVGNACKFTERGEVEVSVDRMDAAPAHEPTAIWLRLQVRDSGIGMNPAQLQRLFQPFSQADESTTRRFGGTGLGLAISHQLVEMMGGRIRVDSAPGQGSRFIVEVPLGLAAPQVPDLPRLEAGVVPGGSDEADEPPHRGDRGGPEAQARAAVRGARVLLVEDNAINRQVAQELLEQAGVLVDVACDGQQALQRLGDLAAQGQRAHDAVLMDLQMPVMDGWTAAARIRTLPGLADLPILAMTANALAEDRARVRQVGMNDHIAKPIVPGDLLRTLARWVPAAPRRTAVGESSPTATAASDAATDDGSDDGSDGLPSGLAGLDLARALERTGGSPSLLRRLLRDLVDDHAQDAARVAQALREGRLDLARQLAHTLKGVAGTLGAADVQRYADGLERALPRGSSAEPAQASQAAGPGPGPDATPGGSAPAAQGGSAASPELMALGDALADALDPLMAGLAAWRAALGPGNAAGGDVRTLCARLEPRLRERDPAAAELAEAVAAQRPDDPHAAELARRAAAFDFDAALDSLQRVRRACEPGRRGSSA